MIEDTQGRLWCQVVVDKDSEFWDEFKNLCEKYEVNSNKRVCDEEKDV